MNANLLLSIFYCLLFLAVIIIRIKYKYNNLVCLSICALIICNLIVSAYKFAMREFALVSLMHFNVLNVLEYLPYIAFDIFMIIVFAKTVTARKSSD